jgi:hypothetical protein
MNHSLSTTGDRGVYFIGTCTSEIDPSSLPRLAEAVTGSIRCNIL